MAQGLSTKIISMVKWIRTSRFAIKNSRSVSGVTDAGRGSTRAENAQGTPTQSHVSPSIFLYTKITPGAGGAEGALGVGAGAVGTPAASPEGTAAGESAEGGGAAEGGGGESEGSPRRMKTRGAPEEFRV